MTFSTFQRTHKTVLIGNHMPRLNAVTQAIRRRVQMVPFRAVFTGTGGAMRERLKAEAGGAILAAWIVAGAAEWQKRGGSRHRRPSERLPTSTCQNKTISDNGSARASSRAPKASEKSSNLHSDYTRSVRGQRQSAEEQHGAIPVPRRAWTREEEHNGRQGVSRNQAEGDMTGMTAFP